MAPPYPCARINNVLLIDIFRQLPTAAPQVESGLPDPCMRTFYVTLGLIAYRYLGSIKWPWWTCISLRDLSLLVSQFLYAKYAVCVTEPRNTMTSLVAFAVLLAGVSQTYAQTAVTVQVGSTLQQIDGFGVSQAFGRAAEFRDMLSGDPQKQGLDYLFNTTTGAGLTIIRNRIGSGTTGDDSILPKSPGGPTAAANYSFDDNDRGQMWFSQQAMKYGVKTIYADAWSAPGFMKTVSLSSGVSK